MHILYMYIYETAYARPQQQKQVHHCSNFEVSVFSKKKQPSYH